MPRLLKIGFTLAVVVAVGLLALCLWGYRTVTGSLPITQGEIALSGLKAKVRVYRDGYHIPHILAGNEYDLFFAQGFVTAQDRLWQMDLRRRTAQGRLSEVFGRRALKADSLMLILGLKRLAQEILPHLSAESKRIYQAYADGINAYIDIHQNKIPVEFQLLNYKPAPWRIEDCIACLRLFGWESSSEWTTDIIMGVLVEKVGWDKARVLIPELFIDDPRTVSRNTFDLSSILDPVLQLRGKEAWPKPKSLGHGWVVSGNRSVTGSPILINHLLAPLRNPVPWYEIHLMGGRFHVHGFTYPGMPMVWAGYNRDIAWGLGDYRVDNIDFFIERLNPHNTMQTLVGKSVRPMKQIVEEIPLKFGSPLKAVIQETDNGPVIATASPEDSSPFAVVIRWVGHRISDEGKALYQLNLAQNWDEFRKALGHFQVPSLSVIYADREGNIGLQAAGSIPQRPRGVGHIPISGENSTSAWNKTIPYEALPSIKNPREGFIAAMDGNIPATGDQAPTQYARDTAYQIRRIDHLLQEKEKFSITDCKQIQSDILSLYALDVLETVLPEISGRISQDSTGGKFVRLLSGWSGEMKAGSSEAVFFEALLASMMKNFFQDELGESLYSAFSRLHSLPHIALERILKHDKHAWIDDITTMEHVETKQELIVKSFHQAAAFLREQFGEDEIRWTWGALHTLTINHPLGKHPLLRKQFNLGPFHIGGSGTTIRCAGHDPAHPFHVVWGASARMIVDLDNPNNSISILPTGQSGQPLDEHYRDQLPLYVGNLYHPNLTDTLKIVQSGWNCLQLIPEGSDE